MQIDDLYERRIDTWIRDFVGATHVLDVYRQKRVDKRKVGAGAGPTGLLWLAHACPVFLQVLCRW
jgi:hypothetical protein